MKFIKKLLFSDDHRVIRNIVSTALYAIALLTFDLSFRIIYRQYNTSAIGEHVPLLFSIFWVTIFCAVSFLLPRLARRIYLILTSFVFALFALVHAFFASFFGTYMSFSSFIFAGEGAAFFEWSYFTIPKKYIFILAVAFFLAVLSALIIPKTKYSPVRVICAVAAFILGIVGINLTKNAFISEEGELRWNSTQSLVEVYESFSDVNLCMHTVGLYHYTYRDFSTVTGLSDVLESISQSDTIAELDKYYKNKEIDPDNEMTGIFEDKNLILIQLESIDTWMINDISMPALAAIQRESIDFTEFYAPKYLKAPTFNTEVIVNTGLPTPMNSSKVSYFTENYYPYSAAHLFADKGYEVESFHRGPDHVYNRGSAHPNWGYSEYYNGFEMEMAHSGYDTCLLPSYDKFVDGDRFMSFIITFSAHGPYEADYSLVKKAEPIIRPALPDDAEDEYVYSLCYAYETDQFIKGLFEKMEDDGTLDNTVVIFYSDHYDHYVTDNAIHEKYKGGTNEDLWCRVPFFIYSKDTEARTVDKVCASYDVLPTIANLFNLDTDGRYYFGNDAFSEGGGYVVFPDFSWYDGETYFDANLDTPTELSRARAKEISERFKMCWNTVKTNYFAKKAKE